MGRWWECQDLKQTRKQYSPQEPLLWVRSLDFFLQYTGNREEFEVKA
jgi:hypothetical protein